jgi:hypothetical protein
LRAAGIRFSKNKELKMDHETRLKLFFTVAATVMSSQIAGLVARNENLRATVEVQGRIISTLDESLKIETDTANISQQNVKIQRDTIHALQNIVKIQKELIDSQRMRLDKMLRYSPLVPLFPNERETLPGTPRMNPCRPQHELAPAEPWNPSRRSI